MAHGMHLSDQVEIVTDRFSPLGAPRGAIGVVVDDWADGSNDVEVSNPETGNVLAHFRAAEDEIRPYSGPIRVKDPREHGILFGRGDDLEVDVEEPPMPDRRSAMQIPGYSPAAMAFSQPPGEDAELAGEIPWELRNEPPTEATFH
jgi:hypothetical protein